MTKLFSGFIETQEELKKSFPTNPLQDCRFENLKFDVKLKIIISLINFAISEREVSLKFIKNLNTKI